MQLLFISSNNIGNFSENSNAFQQPYNLCRNCGCIVMVPEGSTVPPAIATRAKGIIYYKLSLPGFLSFTDKKALNPVLKSLAAYKVSAVVSDFAESSVALANQLASRLKRPWYTILWDPPFSNRYEIRNSLLHRVEHRIRLALYNRQVRHTDAVFCFINKGTIEAEGLRFSKVVQFVNGVDEAIINEILAHRLPRKPYAICVTGRVRKDKGSLLVLEAFRLVAAAFPEATLTFIGQIDGPVGSADRLAVEEALEKHPFRSQITVTGRIPFRQAMQVAVTCEIGLHAYSPAPYLYFNHVLKVGEYQALSVVPVAVKYPGTEDIITDQVDGVLIASNSPTDISRAVSGLFTDRTNMASIATEAGNVVKKRSWQIVTGNMFDAINEMTPVI